jgi:hypothetical protein
MKLNSRTPDNLDHAGFKHGEITQKIIGGWSVTELWPEARIQALGIR